MAIRPVFVPKTQGDFLVVAEKINFLWFAGMATSQKQKSIDSLHEAARAKIGAEKILEVSSKSRDELGVALSAFNLMIVTKKRGRTFSVECAYQSSKVFAGGEQYLDLLDVSSREAKKDPRVKDSGRIYAFNFYGEEWPINPVTAFYDWLYVNALKNKPEYHNALREYSGFTDIEFNPEKSINCQAYSIALFCSLKERGVLDYATESKDNFLKLYRDYRINNTHMTEEHQLGIRM
jgi:hypothetical protein